MNDERKIAALIHLSAFTVFIIPFGNIVAPLLLWILKKEDSAFVDYHGREAVNFQISITIYFAVATAFVILLIGIPFLLFAFLIGLVFPVIAAIKASEGNYYSYPFSIRFL